VSQNPICSRALQQNEAQRRDDVSAFGQAPELRLVARETRAQARRLLWELDSGADGD
jgi:hypothetical protein